MLPSSISAPSTLVPMISAVSGSTTEKPEDAEELRRPGRRCGVAVSFSADRDQIRTSGGSGEHEARADGRSWPRSGDARRRPGPAIPFMAGCFLVRPSTR